MKFKENRAVIAVLVLIVLVGLFGYQAHSSASFQELKKVSIGRKILSEYHRKPMTIGADLLVPTAVSRTSPILFHNPGIGSNSDEYPNKVIRELKNIAARSENLQMIHVFLYPHSEWGYHFFVDSKANGPVSAALVKELIPHIKATLHLDDSSLMYTTGTSSGGWASLWLQLFYPKLFKGAFITAPDPLDFRNFFQVDLSPGSNDSMYYKQDGSLRLERRNGRVSQKEYVETIEAQVWKGTEFASYEASFSELGPDGNPKKLFNRRTGALEKDTLMDWDRYSLTKVFQSQWHTYAEDLKGKVHIVCGSEDTFFLDEPAKLFCEKLIALDSSSTCEIIPGRHHLNIGEPAPAYPNGLLQRILEQIVLRR